MWLLVCSYALLGAISVEAAWQENVRPKMYVQLGESDIVFIYFIELSEETGQLSNSRRVVFELQLQ